MASRLDRLFVLLESGSNSGTRKAAAQQLGQVQRLHPHELPFLLNRIQKCLTSTSWETRIAAGQAVEAILSQLSPWEPNRTDIKVKKEDGEPTTQTAISINRTPSLPTVHKLKFESFDVENLLTTSGTQLLMASEGKVFDRETADTDSDPLRQRSLVNKRLGLDIAEKIGIDTSDIVSNDDFVPSNRDLNRSVSSGSCATLLGEKEEFPFGVEPNLSSREINLAKRRARKQKSREVSEANDQRSTSSSKKIKREDSVPFDAGFGVEEGVNFYERAREEGRWPLEDWVQVLLQDLFSLVWEVRHGAGIAIRVIIRLHGSTAGTQACTPPEENESLHQEWLEDVCLRLASVLILDRFGDFVTDQVVAPVRETCAQCLGTVVSLMSPGKVKSLLMILIQLLGQKPWEVRHGGLLAMKYLFAIRTDLVSELLPVAFPSIFQSLSDGVDDVAAVAASALIPVTEQLVILLPKQAPCVVNVLWESLASLDDLSSACNSIMSLLATLLAFPVARNNLRGLDVLMPRLWPFLHHTSSSVRKSALLTLQKLTELDPSVAPMSTTPLQLTLRHTFHRALLEHIPDVLELIPTVWSQILRSSQLNTLLQAACPMLGIWLYLTMHHPRLPIDPQYLISIPKHSADIGRDAASENGDVESTDKVFISGSGDASPLRLAKTRLSLATMLGQLIPYIVQPLPPGISGEQPLECFVRVIIFHLNTRSALQRTVAALVLSAWDKKSLLDEHDKAQNDSPSCTHPGLEKRLMECLNESIYFDEIAYAMTKLQSECRDFIATLKHYNIPCRPEWEVPGLFSFDQIQKVGEEFVSQIIQKHVRKSKIQDTLLERRKSIWNLYVNAKAEFTSLSTWTLGALAGAVVSLNCLPEKLNPVVKPLMESVRKEENELFQRGSAMHLTQLINLVQGRSPCPVPKIIQNLTIFLCADGEFTPPLHDQDDGILSLSQLSSGSGQQTAELESNSPKKSTAKTEDPTSLLDKQKAMIQRRGATLALTSIVEFFGEEVPEKVKKLWDLTFGILEATSVAEARDEELRKVVDALQILETVSPKFHSRLFIQIENQIGRICELLGHKNKGVRHMASRCLSVWASLMPVKVIPVVVKKVIPRLGGIENEIMRQGAIECLWCIVDKMGLELLPYVVLLVVPVLGRMSDQNDAVRQLASLTFAALVRLMPLEGSIPDPPDLPKDLLHQKEEQKDFLEQLLNPSTTPEYKISVPVKATLRPYQQAGVNWLGFLNKYKLHGILCDDMGLGKTLQSICILGSDHFNRSEAYKIDKSPDNSPLPSIVICPPTLTGHWVYEIENFMDKEYLNPLHYHGPPTERSRLQSRLSHHNLVVASYDIVRNDVDFFSAIHWNYCILDEGHMIKNGKTKISQTIKQIRANHRLILSGTPIQNNVLELWSLFDFLMPGFLGSEKQFSAKYGRPILLARDPKSSPKDQEAGALALEALHRQALPFLLRRLKEDVLQDLPPKITQDYYCDLSPIQEQLYEDFARTRAHQSLRDTFSNSDDSHKNTHIFQALQYLRKVCNHPKLVLTPQHPKYSSVMAHLTQHKTSLSDIKHAAKLPALRQLLLDCGIGASLGNGTEDVVNQHRALIFCQLKVMLDILENDLLKAYMPSVTYLRLDGSVPAGQRHSLVTRFNNDPSIDVLLLTTQVGGLGLNLTGADTVIFVEHDWNPMRDLQAMDRAHRIGQKKVVNVYRLITRGTLEEKIMGLQKFKLLTANTIISQDNSCIETMATDQLLDLFVLEDKQEGKKRNEDVEGIVGAYKNILENVPDLFEDKLYEEEYDLSTFIKNLGK